MITGSLSSMFVELPGFSYPVRQTVSDVLTCSRNLTPVVADTPSICRSTYLLRLNSANRFVAAAHGDKSVSIYCAVNGRLLARCIGHDRSPWTLTFHPSRPYLLASGCLGGDVRTWNLEPLACLDENTTELVTIYSQCRWKHAGAIASLTFHPAQPILTVAWTQEVVFYDWMSGHKLSVWRFVSDHSRVRWVSYSSGGELLYTATANPSSSQPSSGKVPPLGNPVDDNNPVDNAPTRAAPSYCVGSPDSSVIPRDKLLSFLLHQPDSWFSRLGICDSCSVRVCRWAGALGPKFPATHVSVHQGMQNASQLAAVIARNMQLSGAEVSRMVQSLVTYCTEISDASCRLLLDAHPAAVAIIEDMPVKEFLLSRGDYCSNPCVVPREGICCGGHACDLVMTHRDLMKHSICRPCLTAFWLWSGRHVSWWHWSCKSDPNPSEPLTQSQSVSPRFHPNQQTNDSTTTHLPLETNVGVCLNCQACMRSSQSKMYADDDLTITSESGRLYSNDKANSLQMAGLELLRSRLSNANEITPLTYLASELIAEGSLTDFIRSSLLSNPPHSRSLALPHSIAHFLYDFEDGYNSPLPKRRKLEHSSPRSPDSSSSSDSECSDPSISDLIDWTEEAANLGRWMNDNPSQSWNFPRSVHLENDQSALTDDTSSELFPFVALGTRLLFHSSGPVTTKSSNSINSNQLAALSIPNQNSSSAALTACCRCGHIVPETFPVDRESDLSTVVCERFVLPNGQHNAQRPVNDQCALSGTRTMSDVDTQNPSLTDEPNRTVAHLRTPTTDTMYLINQTGGNTVLNSVNRTITEVVAGLFVDMGEHGSSSGLHGSTYRICCWQLNLSDSMSHSSQPFGTSNHRKMMMNLLPMPANMTVSYNTNSLVIPHARLFNDSSICLSPDGRTLAAFVAPDGAVGGMNTSDSASDTILVIYRLQPKSLRGTCLFSHRFTTENPVCLDFSPSGDYLAVGMATTRIPCSEPLPSFNQTISIGDQIPIHGMDTVTSNDLVQGETFVAKIFHLERVLENSKSSMVQHRLREVSTILHPTFLNPRSSRVEDLCVKNVSNGLSDWQRLLLCPSKGISLNTILWNPRGGLIYGTTKGLVVYMVIQPYGSGPSTPLQNNQHEIQLASP